MSLHTLLTGGDRAEQLSLTSDRGWDKLNLSSCGVGPVSSGVAVTPQLAQSLSTYVACIRVISEGLVLAPLKVFRTRKSGGKDTITDHAVSDLLKTKPNDMETAANFRADWVAMALGWKHGHVRIDRNSIGDPVALVRLDAARVELRRDSDGPFYVHFLHNGSNEIIRAENMLDLYGVNAWSAACEGRETLGIALAEQKYAGTFLKQAGAPNGVLTTAGKLSDPAKDHLQKSWQDMHGGAEGAGKIAILSGDMKYQQVIVNPATAQLLESRKFSLEEICRWFGVNPRKVMDRERAQGWSTLEFSDVEHVRDTLTPWAIRLEAMMNLRLFTERERREGFFVKHMFQGFLRGDMKSRVTFYRLLQMEGALTANEIREFEDMNPVEGEGGDTHFFPMSMAPLEDVASGEARNKSGSAPGGGDRGGQGGEANQSGREPETNERQARAAWAEALEPVFEAAFERVVQREYNAVTRLVGKHDTKDARVGAVAGFLEGEPALLMSALEPGLLATGHTHSVCAAIGSQVVHDYYNAAAEAYRATDDVAALAEERRGEQPETWAGVVVQRLTGKDAADAA